MAAIMLPLLLGNVLQQLYNTIDAFMIGRFVGQTAFAAIGVAGTVMNLFIFILSGCCTGISIVLAQLYGSRDEAGFRRAGFLAAVSGGLFTLLFSLLAVAVQPLLLRLMQTPPDVAAYTSIYLNIIFGGLICTFFYNYCAATLRAIGNTRSALYILSFSMATNLILDYVLIAVLNWGIAGAAWATVFSQLVSAAACFFYMRNKLSGLLFTRADAHFDPSLLKRIFGYGAVSAMHQSSLYIGKLLVQGAVNTTGLAGISGYTAATRIEGFTNSFGGSGAEAVSIFVAQSTGAGDRRRSRQVLKVGQIFLITMGLTLSALMAATARWTVPFLLGHSEEETVRQAIVYLQTVSIFYVLGFIGNAFVGYFRGIGMVQIPVIGTTLHISIRVILSYLLIPALSLKAVALSTGAGWICVVIFQYLVYLRTQKRQAAENL